MGLKKCNIEDTEGDYELARAGFYMLRTERYFKKRDPVSPDLDFIYIFCVVAGGGRW